jgi:hypothetical protein
MSSACSVSMVQLPAIATLSYKLCGHYTVDQDRPALSHCHRTEAWQLGQRFFASASGLEQVVSQGDSKVYAHCE